MTTDRPDETLAPLITITEDGLARVKRAPAFWDDVIFRELDAQRRLSAEKDAHLVTLADGVRTRDLVIAEKDAKLAEARDTLSEQSAVIMRLEHSLRDVRDRKDQRIVELVQAQSHWQPIATAPTDGSEILGFMHEWDIDYLGCLRFYRYDDGSSGWRGGSFRSDPPDNWTAFMRPTHWMPLPAKPTEAP